MSEATVNVGSDPSSDPTEAAELHQFLADLDAVMGAEGEPAGDLESATDDRATTDENASVGGTDTDPEDRSPYVSRDRFDQVNTRYRDTLERLKKLEPIEGFSPALQALIEKHGITPEAFQQQIEAYEQGLLQQQTETPAPTPEAEQQLTLEERFHQELQGQGVDPFSLSEEVYEARLARFEVRQFQQDLARRDQANQQMAQQGIWRADVAEVTRQLPAFADPDLRDVLLNTYEGRYGSEPNQARLLQLAKTLDGKFETLARNKLSQAAVDQAQKDNARPDTKGGNPPSPAADDKWVTEASDKDFNKGMKSIIGSLFRAGQR
jgi:hypothetical protein